MKMTKNLIINMVSFPDNWKPIPKSEKTKQVTEVSNQSKADLLVFPGFTIGSEKQFGYFLENCTNNQTLIIMEVTGRKRYFLLIQNGKVLNTKIYQHFTTSDEVEKNPMKMKSFLEKLKNERVFDFNGWKLLLMICGEINFLKSIQGGGKAVIRSKSPEILSSFHDVISNTDIFINPQHSPMSRQGNLDAKRVFLSANHRTYCSTANTDTILNYDRILNTLNGSSVQYCYYNGKKVLGKITLLTENYIVKEYQIPPK